MNASISEYTVDETTTLLEASRVIEQNHMRTAIVLSNEKVVGIVSEGDILRALLKGIDVHAPVRKFMQISFTFLNEKDLAKAARIFRKTFVSLLPVVSHQMELQDVITQVEILNHIDSDPA